MGFLGAKAFFAVVREGVADKPGKILCSVFLFFPGFLGLLGSQGEPGFYFFTGTLWKGSFFGGRLFFFLPFLLLPLMYIQILYSRLVWVYNFFILF